MAFATSAPVGFPRPISLGAVKMEVLSFTAAAADASGTITSKSLHEIDAVIVDGVLCTAQTITNGYPAASVAITFTAVAAGGAVGTVILYGK